MFFAHFFIYFNSSWEPFFLVCKSRPIVLLTQCFCFISFRVKREIKVLLLKISPCLFSKRTNKIMLHWWYRILKIICEIDAIQSVALFLSFRPARRGAVMLFNGGKVKSSKHSIGSFAAPQCPCIQNPSTMENVKNFNLR